MTTDKNNAASDPQPAELAEQQRAALPRPLEELRDAAQHALDCADGGDDYACGRPMIEALTTLGIMEKTGRGLWSTNVQIARSVVDALAATGKQQAGEVHPDDVAVDAFAAAMKAKMADARAKGRGGWEDPAQCSSLDLSRLLRGHVEKGDPRDVANFCMMLWNRQEGIATQVGEVQGHVLASVARAGLPFIAYAFAHGVAGAEEAGRAIEEALAARPTAVQEPVAVVSSETFSDDGTSDIIKPSLPIGTKLYAAPPAQGIDLGQLRRCTHAGWRDPVTGSIKSDMVLAPDGEWVRLGYVRALIDQRDAAPGVDRG